MHRGSIRGLGTPEQLKAEVAGERLASAAATASASAPASASGETEPESDPVPPTLEDVFRHFAGDGMAGGPDDQTERFRDVRRTRRTASRVG
jgi:ABC-2 type transport system ATP-binding protein